MANYKSKAGVVLRFDSGNLTAAETVVPITGLGAYNRAVIGINILANMVAVSNEEVDFFIETSYDAAANIYVDSTTNTAETVEVGETAIGVVSGAVFEVGDVIRMDEEKMLITGIVTNVITVTRAHENTFEATHITALDIFLLRATWVVLARLNYDNSEGDGIAPYAVITVGSAPNSLIVDVQPTVADDAIQALPLGDRLRIRTAINDTPTYRYEAVAQFYTD